MLAAYSRLEGELHPEADVTGQLIEQRMPVLAVDGDWIAARPERIRVEVLRDVVRAHRSRVERRTSNREALECPWYAKRCATTNACRRNAFRVVRRVQLALVGSDRVLVKDVGKGSRESQHLALADFIVLLEVEV